MPSYLVDVDRIVGQNVIMGSPSIIMAPKRIGIVGGAVLDELRALVNGNGTTAVSIPDGLCWELKTGDAKALDPDKDYTVFVADPDVSSGPWSTLQAIAAALQP